MRSNLKQLVLQEELKRGDRIANVEISKATGLDANTISRWMSPKPFESINSKAAIALCQWLDCSLGDLLVIEPAVDLSAN